MKAPDRFPLYPFLFAIHPVLFLCAANRRIVDLSSCIKPAVILLVSTLVLLFVTAAILRNRTKSGLVVSVLLVFVFSYGHAVDLLQPLRMGFPAGKLIFPIWVMAMVVLTVLLIRTARSLESVARFMAAAGILLVAMTLVQIAAPSVTRRAQSAGAWDKYVTNWCSRQKIPSAGARPDIYYIVLDAYTSKDVLAGEFRFDNSDFERNLRRKGFYVASESACNYPRTTLSVPSTLNLDYLDVLEHDSGVSGHTVAGLRTMFQKPKLVEFLKRAGYATVMIRSGYSGYYLSDPDIVLSSSPLETTEFDLMLFETSIVRVVPGLRLRGWRQRCLGSLELLGRIPKTDRPKFVFAHLVVSHPPFCFDSDGNMPCPAVSEAQTARLGREKYAELYTGSIAYLNKRLETLIDRILAESKTPPVIVLQADHGAVCGFPTARSRIFSAYHLPDGAAGSLYPSITSVNTFRVVLNSCFHTRLPLLDDDVYQAREHGDRFSVERITPDTLHPPTVGRTPGI